MPKLQINKDLKQLNINFNIKTKIVFKLRGQPKGLKNKIYTLNPKFNKET